MSTSAADFKATMRHTAAGVVVISTIDSNEMFGFTANSFTSLSLSPPMVLFCISNNSRSLRAFHRSGKFAVSVLSSNQSEISRNFATCGINKFAEVNYTIGDKSQCPLINDAVCWFECIIKHEYDGGDHTIIIGEVEVSQINNDCDPLIYHSCSYHKIEKK